jgi:hypothetical protein
MPKYRVPMYFIVETEVEADSPEDALQAAGQDDDEFDVVATYVHCGGGPAVNFDNFGTPKLVQEKLT